MVFSLPFRIFKMGYSAMFDKGPHLLVVCGPSGSGKSTLLKQLFQNFPDLFGFSISHTTRKPRPGEEHGKQYYFTDKSEMEKQIDNNEFIETASFSNNLYGTSKKAVEDVQRAGKVCVLDIDVQGVKQIKKSTPNSLYVFIKPPSISELERRLRSRNTEDNDSLLHRLETAKTELKYAEEASNFDMIIVNDKFDEAYEALKKFVMNEYKRQHQMGESESRST